MDEAGKRYVALKRRARRARAAAEARQPVSGFPTPVGGRKAADSDRHTLWAWCDTKFATLADVWPGAWP